MNKKFRLVCMGDSLTDGYTIGKENSWPGQLARQTGWEVINSGISGDTTTGMLMRFQHMALDYDPDMIVISGGTNDVWMGVETSQILSNFLAMTRQAKSKSIPCVIGLPTPYFPDDSSSSTVFLAGKDLSLALETYRQKLLRFAVEDEMPYIDFGLEMKPDLYLEDGMHPNEKGHTLMMEHALAVIQSLMP